MKSTSLLLTIFNYFLNISISIAAFVIICLLLGKGVIPSISKYVDKIEERIKEETGFNVKIKKLSGDWKRGNPVLEARDVSIGTSSIGRILIVPDLWKSVLKRKINISYLELRDVDLRITQRNDKTWCIEEFLGEGKGFFSIRENLCQQVKTLSVIDGKVEIKPQYRPTLKINKMSFTLDLNPVKNSLSGRFDLPEKRTVEFNLKVTGRLDDLNSTEGSSYINLPQADYLTDWIPKKIIPLNFELDKIEGRGDIYITWKQGKIRNIASKLYIADIQGGYQYHEHSKIEDVSIRSLFRRNNEGASLSLDAFSPHLGGHIKIEHLCPKDESKELWKIEADRVDLGKLISIGAPFLPLPIRTSQFLDKLAIKGDAKNVSITFNPKKLDYQKLQFYGDLEQLSFSAVSGSPAIENLSGKVIGDLLHGELLVDSHDLGIYISEIFLNQWTYKQADAVVSWSIKKETLNISVPFIKFLNKKERIIAKFLTEINFNEDRHMGVNLRLDLVDSYISDFHPYIPKKLSKKTSQILKKLAITGTIDTGSYIYNSSSKSNSDLFLVISKANLSFGSNPFLIKNLAGQLSIKDKYLEFKGTKGEIMDSIIQEVEVYTPLQYQKRDSAFLLFGNFSGDLSDGLDILKYLPFDVSNETTNWEGEGDLSTKVDLNIPLEGSKKPIIELELKIHKGLLKIPKPKLIFSELNGVLNFKSTRGLDSSEIHAYILGEPIQAKISSKKKSDDTFSTRILANSKLRVSSLENWLNINSKLPLSGEIPYQMELILEKNKKTMHIESNLEGTSVNLPFPFNLSLHEKRKFLLNLMEDETNEYYELKYGELTSFRLLVPKEKMNDYRGELYLGSNDATIPSSPKIRIRGLVEKINLEEWFPLTKNLAEDSYIRLNKFLQDADLKIDKLNIMDTSFEKIELKARHISDCWILEINSPQFSGLIKSPDLKDIPISLYLEDIYLNRKSINSLRNVFTKNSPSLINLTTIPAIEISIDNVYEDLSLVGGGSFTLRIDTEKVLLEKIKFSIKGISVEGDYSWKRPLIYQKDKSWFRGKVSGYNLQDLLGYVDLSPAISSTDFCIDVDGYWPGNVKNFNLRQFSGSIKLQLNKGQIIDIGNRTRLLKIFGLLNINSIQRRLGLDFSDIFKEGLSYDTIRAFVAVDLGVYSSLYDNSKLLTISGPSGEFEVKGGLDMANDWIDARLLVSLPITSNLPIMGLIAGSPAIGGTLYLFNRIVEDQNIFSGLEYSIRGPVRNPKVVFSRLFQNYWREKH